MHGHEIAAGREPVAEPAAEQQHEQGRRFGRRACEARTVRRLVEYSDQQPCEQEALQAHAGHPQARGREVPGISRAGRKVRAQGGHFG
jgi:hypothetical protein